MDHDHGGPLAHALAAHEIGIDPAFGGIVGNALGNEPGIVASNGGGFRKVTLKKRQQRSRGCRRARDLRKSIEKFAAAHPAMDEAIIEIDDFLVHGILLLQNEIPNYRRGSLLPATYLLWVMERRIRSRPVAGATPAVTETHLRAGR